MGILAPRVIRRRDAATSGRCFGPGYISISVFLRPSCRYPSFHEFVDDIHSVVAEIGL